MKRKTFFSFILLLLSLLLVYFRNIVFLFLFFEMNSNEADCLQYNGIADASIISTRNYALTKKCEIMMDNNKKDHYYIDIFNNINYGCQRLENVWVNKLLFKTKRKCNSFENLLRPFSNSLLLFLLLCAMILPFGNSNVFLRMPSHLADNEENSSQQTIRGRRSVVPSWRSSVREKAKTFGQSNEEIARVQYYFTRLKEIAEKKHPALPLNSQNLQTSNGSQNADFKMQLDSWNSRRMSDDRSRKSLNPEYNLRYFEGDIVLTGDQAEELFERSIASANRRVKRKFIGSNVRRWDPTKPIYYSFDGSHTLREQKVIELALEHWRNITCLNFERRNDEPKGNRIVFTDVDGCASNVGKHPLGEPQYVSLAPECIRLGVIAHEVAHALGFWHEQSRPDRDFYVRVRWDNIDLDSKGQFLKEQPADVDNGGVPYDYGSIMHYRYDDLFTLNTYIGDYQRTIGQRDQLSFNDIRLMNNIYCKNTCPQKLSCQRGGYTDPRRCDRCRCPDGFIGKVCEEVMPGYGAECGGRIEVNGNWQEIHSPRYPYGYKEGQECSWLLVAPPEQHIEFQFVREFEMYCKVRHSLCMDYVEIRNSTDFANTGMRYCCLGTPPGSIVSATGEMLVLFRSFYRGGKGFMAQARAIPRTGEWTEWTQSSECTATCGACGVRKRTRTCEPPNGYCLGHNFETEVCNTQPCPGLCARKRTEDAECTGFLSLLKGVKCKTETTYHEECNETCCKGYVFMNGNCVQQEV